MTSFLILCPHCAARLSVRKELLAAIQGKSITCKACTKSFLVNKRAGIAPPAAPPPAGSLAPRPKPSEAFYRYKNNGRISEPVGISELQRLATAGILQPYDHVAREGQEDWLLASTVVSFTPPLSTAPALPAEPKVMPARRTLLKAPRPSRFIHSCIYFATCAAVACYLVWYVLDAYSAFHFNSILGGQDASSVIAIEQNAHWLDWYLPRIPSLLQASTNAVTRHDGTAEGRWHYEVKTKDGKTISFVQSEALENRSLDSFGRQWIKHMVSLGYVRTNWQERPAAIRVEEFSIKEPGGAVWTIRDHTEGSSDAFRLLTLAVMLGTSRYKGDIKLLSDVDRGSFAYAFSFAATSSMIGFDDAIKLSCERDRRRRFFASEVLLSTIPAPQHRPLSQQYDLKQYDSALAELSEEMDFAAKKMLYDRMRSRSASYEISPDNR